MPPMIERPVRLVAYLGVAAIFGGLLALLMQTIAPGSLRGALALCLPLALVYGFQCLSVWYPVRQLPASRAGAPQLVLLLTLASFASAAIWTAAGHLWAAALGRSAGFPDLPARYATALPLFFVLGVFLFILATLVHFLFVVVERSRDAERRGLEREVHAREAELKSLKAQLDPHFLFNSLNSVSALIGSDPPAARRMCYLMAGFFRKSLGLGQKEQIALAEEIYLASTADAITLTVQDDGVGFDTQQLANSHRGLGLISMAERLRLVRGTVTIDSIPHQGTRLYIKVPHAEVPV